MKHIFGDRSPWLIYGMPSKSVLHTCIFIRHERQQLKIQNRKKA